jgi:peptide subunit release factor 1 (eRF1)
MISQKDLRDLLAFESQTDSPVLSVYLNIDQSQAVNLNRGFEAALKSLLQKAEKEIRNESERKSFLEDAQGVVSFVNDVEPDAKSLILFHDASRDYLWNRSLEISLPNAVHWQSRPYIRPLLEARDEYQRYGVILADRARARLFIVVMKSIEEIREAWAEADVKKFDASGTDQMLSQMNFQRKADEHAKWHLKNVAERMEKLADRYKFDSLILAGTHEVVSELKHLLSDRLEKSVVGTLSLPIDAQVAEILEETIDLQEKHERVGEMQLVDKLLTAAAKNHQAVTGLTATLEALLDGRIRQLIYTERYASQGGDCQQCGALFESPLEQCPRCEGEVREVQDLLESVVVRVAGEGGIVEQVRGDAAEALTRHAGGIGAFLRF